MTQSPRPQPDERQGSEAAPRSSSDAPAERSEVVEHARGRLHAEAVLPPEATPQSVPAATSDRLFFLAHRQPDGTYTVTLTEEGMRTFETALGIADDLGGKTRISPHSSIADIMDRTATREELAQVLRSDGAGFLHRIRITVLKRKLRGSENPSAWQRTIGYLGKFFIVGIVALWTLNQFGTAIQDIEAIPGILANIPGDILHFHPTSAFDEVGKKIADAGDHVLTGVLGTLLTVVVVTLIRPLARMYRKDQLVPGERFLLRWLCRLLGMAEKRVRRAP